MFSKLAFVASLALLAVATPVPNEPASQCSTAPVQCCQTVEPASDPTVAKELGLLGVVVQGVDVLVGLTCTPISVIGVGSGASCSAQAVCCENNGFHGVVAVGCTPVDLSA